MPGKIFFRERTTVDEGDQQPRFNVVAVAGVDVTFLVSHVRKRELEHIARELDAGLIELTVDDKGHKLEDEGQE